jgi:Flp pilus assembly protein TadB
VKYNDEVKAIRKSVALSMVPVLAVAAVAMLLPVPGSLVAPVIIGAGWVTGRVMNRRLKRRLDAMGADALRSKS